MHEYVIAPMDSPTFSHEVEIEFDDVSAKARMGMDMVVQLEALFARTTDGLRFERRFVRATRNRKRNTARSTTHVLSLGRIDSALCFSPAKFRKDKKFWITPNGWKTATFASNLLFVGECQVRENEMMYRFTLLRWNAEANMQSERVGAWSPSLQTAFTLLYEVDPFLEVETNWTKVSKEVLIAVHCDLVQASLLEFWEKLKSKLSACALAIAYQFESHPFAPRRRKGPALPQVAEDEASTSRLETVTDAASALVQLQRLPAGFSFTQILRAEEFVQLFAAMEGGGGKSSPDLVTIKEMLYLLDASGGARVDLLLHFLSLCDDAANLVFAHLGEDLEQVLAMMLGKPADNQDSPAKWLQDSIAELGNSSSLHVRAVLLVFERMRHIYPGGLPQLRAERDSLSFRKRILRLPQAQTARKRLREMISEECQLY